MAVWLITVNIYLFTIHTNVDSFTQYMLSSKALRFYVELLVCWSPSPLTPSLVNSSTGHVCSSFLFTSMLCLHCLLLQLVFQSLRPVLFLFVSSWICHFNWKWSARRWEDMKYYYQSYHLNLIAQGFHTAWAGGNVASGGPLEMGVHVEVTEFAPKHPSQELKAFHFNPFTTQYPVIAHKMFDKFVCFTTRWL